MELIKSSEMKSAFVNLFNLYAHELSKYNPWIGTQIDSDGNYLSKYVNEYLNDETLDTFCIVDDQRPIGFAVFSYSDSSEENACSIEEIFIIQTSRGKGICETICKDFWRKNKGICTLHVLKENHPAITYWEKVISKSGYTYKKHDKNDQMWLYKINLESNI